ncbi:hypothetical protein BCR36DRAFT_353855 [Piromyces finnis]|uniref:SNARE-complex protein Syntaxin-18 N-terminal domain-containing protein n=1 Tax=Piromyces finnis TaxID=1754191 RepID=A0A1Y1V7X0_9FUNG|nr:hypothetical protein BCR36DRAFT_353855 [Piromyces finnis]|eukprot:ORX49357.1 hypothetical protein BCR36DRAFT_353855 [Piromyces finnis]
MDITEKFFSIVKECQQINNVINEETGKSNDNDNSIEPVTYSKFKQTNWKPEENEIKDAFLKEAYQIEKKIYQLQNFLLSIRKSYLNISHLNSTSTLSQVVYFPFNFDDNDTTPKSIAIQNMTDRQRDDIDQLSKQYIKTCEVQINNLNLKIKQNLDEIIGERRGSFFSKKRNEFDIDKQIEVIFLHREGIVYSLNILLMKIADILKNQQEKRLEQNLQKKESLVHKASITKKSATETMLSSKLGTGASTPFKFLNNKNPFKTTGNFTSSNPISNDNSTYNNTEFNNTQFNITGDNATDPNIKNSSSLNNKGFLPIEDEINNYYEFEDNELSQELRMELEEENQEMLEELESDMNQVRQATQSINEISQLQATLSQQLQIQQNIIETLHEDSWKSVDTMKQANQKLLSAQRHFSDRRVWMLFFLIISSLILLFLDWFYS